MSSQWGRIGDDGTVYVRTSDGERVIGSWQAGDAEAGLAYYVRHFEDFQTEVTLLETRLGSGATDANAARTQAEALKSQLPNISAIGDLASLDTRLDVILAAADAKAQAEVAARALARASAVAAKEALVTEAETIAESATNWKVSGDRLRDILGEWKQIKGVDRRTDDTLWKRFSTARDAFGKRRGQHFAQLDSERELARSTKQRLLERAEALSGSSDWKQTATDMKDLMTEWKAAPRASRDVEDSLWAKFRAAQDAFFSRRSGVFAERDSEQVNNLREKERIITAAEAIELSDVNAAQSSLRTLQSQFDEIGHVPRESMRRTDDRMRAAEQRVRDAVDAQWRRSSMESNPFLNQLRERLAEAEAKLERARRSGDAGRIAKAEADVAQRRALLPS
jgi:hypothetical protein